MRQFAMSAGPYFAFVSLVVLTAIFMSTDNSLNVYYSRANIVRSIDQSLDWVTTRYWYTTTTHASISAFWFWIRSPVLSTVFGNSAPIYDDLTIELSPPTDSSYWLLGPMRLRQIRVNSRSCPTGVLTDAERKCVPDFSLEQESTETYGVGEHYVWRSMSELGALPQYGGQSWFPGSGYVLDLQGGNFSEINATLGRIQDEQWIDEHTRVVFLDMAFYSFETSLILKTHYAIEFGHTGDIQTAKRVTAFRYVPQIELWDVVLLILQFILVFANVAFLWGEVSEMKEIFTTETGTVWRRAGLYIRGSFNVWDLINIITFFAIFILQLIRVVEEKKQIWGKIYKNEFLELDYMTWLITAQRELSAFYVLLVFGKTVKYLQLIPVIGPALNAIFQTIVDKVIFSFIAFVLLVMLVFSLVFHIAFGPILYRYHTIERAWLTIMFHMFGTLDTQPAASRSGPYAQAGGMGFLLGVSLLSANLIVMNITVAVVGKAYDQALVVHSKSAWDRMLHKLEAQALWRKLPPASDARPNFTLGRFGSLVWSAIHWFRDVPRVAPAARIPHQILVAWKKQREDEEVTARRDTAALHQELDNVKADMVSGMDQLADKMERLTKLMTSPKVRRVDDPPMAEVHAPEQKKSGLPSTAAALLSGIRWRSRTKTGARSPSSSSRSPASKQLSAFLRSSSRNLK
mmetsp:Transcript_40281/g.87171  ORF Transcript_40281/g.87171 Transcript_40281/m.87171 type:complete len:686 (-) Transcript_40281:106-2163(-)